MAKNILLDNLYNIYNIADANGVTIDTARSLFEDNLNDTFHPDDDVFYEGAVVDYPTVAKAWDATDRKVKNEWRSDVQMCVWQKNIPLAKAWNAKNRAEFDAIVDAWLAEWNAAKAAAQKS